MGVLISAFFNPDLPSDVVVDFDKIDTPTNKTELELYNSACQVIENAETMISVIDGYKGNANLIREAMQHPEDQALQLAMFEGMFPNIDRIKAFHILANSINELSAKFCQYFIDSNTFPPALLKCFALVLNVSLNLDRAKMMHPEIQNDFSQYRRSLSRNPRHPGIPVNDVEANGISMFIAQATPVIASLATTLDNLQKSGKDVAKFLADFAHICCAFVMREKAHNTAHAVTALTAMTVAFILYDNLTPVGVFGKGSIIDVKTCVGQIRVLNDSEKRGMLCDTLHYSTRSFDKASENIKRVIELR